MMEDQVTQTKVESDKESTVPLLEFHGTGTESANWTDQRFVGHVDQSAVPILGHHGTTGSENAGCMESRRLERDNAYVDQLNDVERNPRLADQNIAQFATNVEMGFAQIKFILSTQSKAISQQMNDHFGSLGDALHRIKDDLHHMKLDIGYNRSDISKLQQDSVLANDRIGEIERRLDQIDTTMREKNLKFFGIIETDDLGNCKDIDEIVDTLNYHSPNRTWQTSDIVQTQRIGQKSQNRDSPHPLIVMFLNPDDKVHILKDQQLRSYLRQSNIRVSTDLSPSQQQRLQQLRSEGKVAYYHKGRLRVDSDSSHSYRNDADHKRHPCNNPPDRFQRNRRSYNRDSNDDDSCKDKVTQSLPQSSTQPEDSQKCTDIHTTAEFFLQGNIDSHHLQFDGSMTSVYDNKQWPMIKSKASSCSPFLIPSASPFFPIACSPLQSVSPDLSWSLAHCPANGVTSCSDSGHRQGESSERHTAQACSMPASTQSSPLPACATMPATTTLLQALERQPFISRPNEMQSPLAVNKRDSQCTSVQPTSLPHTSSQRPSMSWVMMQPANATRGQQELQAMSEPSSAPEPQDKARTSWLPSSKSAVLDITAEQPTLHSAMPNADSTLVALLQPLTAEGEPVSSGVVVPLPVAPHASASAHFPPTSRQTSADTTPLPKFPLQLVAKQLSDQTGKTVGGKDSTKPQTRSTTYWNAFEKFKRTPRYSSSSDSKK